MLEDKDIQKLKDVLATKEDLKTFATKEDLEKFSLKAFETFATKEDLNEMSSKLLQEIFATKEDFENFKEEMRKSFSNLQTSVDAYAKRADTYFQEMVMLSQ